MKPSTTITDVADKMSAERLEVVHLKEAVTEGDYAGAAAKTDPVEIKLVHKLDYRIMVCCRTLLIRCADKQSPRSW
jgi:hypothetical protein